MNATGIDCSFRPNLLVQGAGDPLAVLRSGGLRLEQSIQRCTLASDQKSRSSRSAGGPRCPRTLRGHGARRAAADTTPPLCPVCQQELSRLSASRRAPLSVATARLPSGAPGVIASDAAMACACRHRLGLEESAAVSGPCRRWLRPWPANAQEDASVVFPEHRRRENAPCDAGSGSPPPGRTRLLSCARNWIVKPPIRGRN